MDRLRVDLNCCLVDSVLFTQHFCFAHPLQLQPPTSKTLDAWTMIESRTPRKSWKLTMQSRTVNSRKRQAHIAFELHQHRVREHLILGLARVALG
jgi:hypothetical protein